ncbi:methyltransferase [Fragilaria crotonensis]|nr:methyltransferase [Fragilaria crotonensis]
MSSGFRKFDKTELSLGCSGGKRKGFFVDLAANDATFLSNTYSLEKKFGWTGLCIEPNPIYWANHTYRDCQVVAAVVGKERMEEVRFRFNNGVFGGITGDGFDNRKEAEKVADLKYTVTLKEILERFKAPKQIDYLSLDVEGAESFILEQFPWTDYNVSLMTIERPKEDLKALLDQNGYKFLKKLSSWGETLWAHESMMDSLDLLILNEYNLTRSPTRYRT